MPIERGIRIGGLYILAIVALVVIPAKGEEFILQNGVDGYEGNNVAQITGGGWDAPGYSQDGGILGASTDIGVVSGGDSVARATVPAGPILSLAVKRLSQISG